MTSILLQKNVPCTVRNGTTLYADIYQSDQEGKFPVLLKKWKNSRLLFSVFALKIFYLLVYCLFCP